MSGRRFSVGAGRLLAGVAWVVLLLGLWLWGRDIPGLRTGLSAPTTGDVAAVGRPLGVARPNAVRPLAAAPPRRVEIPALRVRAPVVGRGLDRDGAIEPPSYDTPDTVAWYDRGVTPGAAGTALLVAHVDTETGPAVFSRLGGMRPGQRIRVLREDGRTAEFTVDDVRVFARDRFDAQKAYGPRLAGRAELRLITCGGAFDRAEHRYTANVVVSAYLSGVGA
ncbi:class F sortase [Streptomyces minutiscleroticus]|uniref:class F sortase n=1 Tax=Streptomyces minutiscleroticus TaxID=68238 RepID=UPI001E41C477|nr:class F sortase [Streptomyces minutiscleroticus]